MQSSSIEQEILKCENLYWEALKENDVESAVALTKFPCLVSGPQGTHQFTEDEYRKLMETADGSQFEGIQIEDPKVQLLSENSAVITYSFRINGMKMLDTSFWIKENDEWSCGYHSEFPEMKEKPVQ